MQVEYVANAGFVLTLRDGRVLLTDPWTSDAIYYGSWFNYPPLSAELRDHYAALRPDWIYISHLHPDHLDPATLCRYPLDTPILIGRLPHRHLHRAVAQLGFTRIRELPLDEPTDLDGIAVTILGQFAPAGYGATDAVDYAIDTSLVARDTDGTSLLHVVDNPITLAAAEQIVERFGHPDVAMLPFSGAGPYPHAFAYADADKDRRTRELRERSLGWFLDLTEILQPRFAIPAAGAYILGGRLAPYNRWLNQATPAQVREAWEEAPGGSGRARVALRILAPGDCLDTEDGIVTASGPAEFTAEQRLEYGLTLRDRVLPQDAVAVPADFRLPWARLLARARANQWRVQEQLGVFPHTLVEIHGEPSAGVPGEFIYRYALDQERGGERDDRALVSFTIDTSLLLMILVGAAIWNNVEIGALLRIHRSPDHYDSTVHSLMAYFTLLG